MNKYFFLFLCKITEIIFYQCNPCYLKEQDLAYDEGDEDNEHDTDNMVDNNEVEIIDDSNEGPNQSEGSNSTSGITESNSAPSNTSQQIQTISSGSEGILW